MSGQTFKVGEIAILIEPSDPDWPAGIEVTIAGPLELVTCECGCKTTVLAHFIGLKRGIKMHAPPSALRKRRPPQDWVRICHLDSLPLDVVMDETQELVQS